MPAVIFLRGHVGVLFCSPSAMCTIPALQLLTKNRASDNVGPCQALLSALLHALKKERHFAPVEGVAFPTVGSLVIVFRPGLSPTHASLRSQPEMPNVTLPGKVEKIIESVTSTSAPFLRRTSSPFSSVREFSAKHYGRSNECLGANALP